MPKPTLHILTGPTAVGKTALALEWAQIHGAEILSCDAFQVYRGMDIGTAKPSIEERRGIAHHCLDIRDPEMAFSVKEFSDAALEAARQTFARGKKLLVVGGSGFYLKSFFAPVADAVAVPPQIVREIRALETGKGLAGLVEALRALNPEGLHDVDLHNPRRVVSALGRCMASGKTLAQLREAFAHMRCPFDDFERKTVLLTRSSESLRARAQARVKAMLAAGLVEEVRRLALRIVHNPSAASAIGYRETLAWLSQENPPALDSLEAQITQNTWKLLRKQRTWFRHQLVPDRTVDLDVCEVDAAHLFDF